jgi:hypothetical protein
MTPVTAFAPWISPPKVGIDKSFLLFLAKSLDDDVCDSVGVWDHTQHRAGCRTEGGNLGNRPGDRESQPARISPRLIFQRVSAGMVCIAGAESVQNNRCASKDRYSRTFDPSY